jgi:hypothetical protein
VEIKVTRKERVPFVIFSEEWTRLCLFGYRWGSFRSPDIVVEWILCYFGLVVSFQVDPQ